MKRIVFLLVMFVIFSGSAFSGEVHIGGINIDGKQYGGIHSDSGQITGPVHLEETFHVQGGIVTGSGVYQDPAYYQSPRDLMNDQVFIINEEDLPASSEEVVRTPISAVLQNIYETTGKCEVYRTSGIFSSKVGTLDSGFYDQRVGNLIMSFWYGTIQEGVSFKNAQDEWFLEKRIDGGLDLRKK